MTIDELLNADCKRLLSAFKSYHNFDQKFKIKCLLLCRKHEHAVKALMKVQVAAY